MRTATAPMRFVEIRNFDGLVFPVQHAIFCPDERFVLAIYEIDKWQYTVQPFRRGGIPCLLDLEADEIIRWFGPFSNPCESIALHATDGLALSSDAKGAIDLWDVGTGRRIRRFARWRGLWASLTGWLTGRLSTVVGQKVIFSPDGRFALSFNVA